MRRRPPAKPIQPKLRLRDRRRRMMWVKVAAGSAVVLVALAAAFYVARLPSLSITAVKVEGAKMADAEIVEEIIYEHTAGSYFFVIPRTNAFFLPRAAIRDAVFYAFPEVAAVTLTQDDIQTLIVTLAERVPVALWCSPAQAGTAEAAPCYFMDKTGFIFTKADSTDGYVRYFGPLEGQPIGNTFITGDFEILHSFIGETSHMLNRTAESVSVESNNDVALAFAGGGVLRFVRTDDTQTTLDNIASVFGSQSFKTKREFEYADFRYGNKVYVKFKGE